MGLVLLAIALLAACVVVQSVGMLFLGGDRGSHRSLLGGWSTAFVFAVVNRMYEYWRHVHDAS